MPFDAAGFPPGRPDPGPPPRRNDNVAVALVIVIAFTLLATPLSVAACSDIVHYTSQR